MGRGTGGRVPAFPRPNRSALPNLLLPGQYHGHDNDGYAGPQLECVLET
jgi:hypothetical protein